MRTVKHNPNTAFTLIELLVVIAIIAILAAILFPVFSAAREKARQTGCASNEKQIALAILQYVQDYDEYYYTGSDGAANGWTGAIYPYTKTILVLQCPSDLLGNTPTGGNYVCLSYAFNRNIDGKNKVGGQLPTFNSPSSTVVLSEVAGWRRPATDFSTFSYNDVSDWGVGVDGNGLDCNGSCGSFVKFETGPMGVPTNNPATLNPANTYDQGFPNGRHTGGSNFAFADGHVKWMVGTAVSPGSTPVTNVSGCSQGVNQAQSTCNGFSGKNYNSAGTGQMGTNRLAATFSPL